MPDKKLALDLKRNKPPGSRGRSDLYRYILDNWAELQAYGYGLEDGPTWQELTDRLSRLGQVNCKGRPLRRLQVRAVFLRVQAQVQAAETKRRTGLTTKTQPRAPANWQPPVAAAPPATLPVREKNHQAPFAPSLPSTGSTDRSRMTPEERLADVRRVIDKRSGR
ncbi:hypothetical protein [Roseomonas gilardii]|uniref:hypothetical protein n=1 Tax=Roseomonas gilardii TaxID=257708 RepID=UPI0011A8965E|nr:hypothetical protein [Roseomonas gilardii]